jgi:hypothetical protein
MYLKIQSGGAIAIPIVCGVNKQNATTIECHYSHPNNQDFRGMP